MDKYLYQITGSIISKKNRYRTGNWFFYKDKKTVEREADVFGQLQKQWVPKIQIEQPVRVKAFFVMESNRKHDLTNMRQSIEDMLVKYGFLKDDNSKIEKDIRLYEWWVDKKSPFCKFSIELIPLDQIHMSADQFFSL